MAPISAFPDPHVAPLALSLIKGQPEAMPGRHWNGIRSILGLESISDDDDDQHADAEVGVAGVGQEDQLQQQGGESRRGSGSGTRSRRASDGAVPTTSNAQAAPGQTSTSLLRASSDIERLRLECRIGSRAGNEYLSDDAELQLQAPPLPPLPLRRTSSSSIGTPSRPTQVAEPSSALSTLNLAPRAPSGSGVNAGALVTVPSPIPNTSVSVREPPAAATNADDQDFLTGDLIRQRYPWMFTVTGDAQGTLLPETNEYEVGEREY